MANKCRINYLLEFDFVEWCSLWDFRFLQQVPLFVTGLYRVCLKVRDDQEIFEAWDKYRARNHRQPECQSAEGQSVNCSEWSI